MSRGFPAGTICPSCLAREAPYTACFANFESYRHGKVMYLEDIENENVRFCVTIQPTDKVLTEVSERK